MQSQLNLERSIGFLPPSSLQWLQLHQDLRRELSQELVNIAQWVEEYGVSEFILTRVEDAMESLGQILALKNTDVDEVVLHNL